MISIVLFLMHFEYFWNCALWLPIPMRLCAMYPTQSEQQVPSRALAFACGMHIA
jgi:hypothetical protein